MTLLETVAHLPCLARVRAARRYACLLAATGAAGALPIAAPAAGAWSDEVPRIAGVLWTWQQTQMSDGTSLAPDDPTRYTLELLPDGRAAVRADCNRGAGPYTLEGQRITIGSLALTRAACLPGSLERTLVAQLGQAAIAFSRGPDLYLDLAADSGTMRFAPADQAGTGQPQLPLEGTAWTAETYNNGRGGVLTLIEGTAITARFEGGRVAGSAGCNSYSAPYALNGNTVEIRPAISTLMACVAPPGRMEQERDYLAAIATARTYRIEGGKLILETADGATVATFGPAAGALAPGTAPIAARDSSAKINFDLAPIDDTGLIGPPDGRVAVAYEFCIPSTPTQLAGVQRIDRTVRAQSGSPGRIGCRPGEEVLCVSSTHQPAWRSVLQELAALDYVARIDRHFAE